MEKAAEGTQGVGNSTVHVLGGKRDRDLGKNTYGEFQASASFARLAPNREIRIGTLCSGSFADCVSVVAFLRAVRHEYPEFRVRYMFHCEKLEKRRE